MDTSIFVREDSRKIACGERNRDEQEERKIERMFKMKDLYFVCTPKGKRMQANWVSAVKRLLGEAPSCSTDVSEESASSIIRVDEQAARVRDSVL
jgi:hypothetical protein